MPIVGSSVRRKEGPEKLCGKTEYIDDYKFPGCLYGATLRSGIPYGRIKGLNFDPDFPWDEYVIASAQDIPGENVVTLIENDQPLLAWDLVMHSMEPILLVAHPIRQKAYAALAHIKVDYEPLEPALTITDSLALKARLYGSDNVFKSFLIEKGDVEQGFTQADFVVEGEYRVGHQEQLYIENNGIASYIEEDGTVVVLGSMQCPYYVHKALMRVFNKPEGKIRVIQTATGGGFGGKEEYPSMIAGHAALLAHKACRPVKLIYDRMEDMAATTKRHPAVVRHRTALSREGKLLAQDIEVLMDGGAYVTLSPVVLSRGTLHAAGPYECPRVRVRSKVLATNTPPNGAFRGFGAPQTLFAAELHWEKIAAETGLDSLDLRRKNLFREGSVTATGQILKESVGAREVLHRCVKTSRYLQKRRTFARLNRKKGNPTWKGIGLALCHHGAGFTGSGEVMLKSRAGIALTREGQIRVLAASTEIGQGTSTLFAQITAEALGVPYDLVEVEIPDTGKVPNSGPTVASRTCMIVGELVYRAALQMKDTFAAKGLRLKTKADLRKAGQLLCDKAPLCLFIVEYEKPEEIHWDDKFYRGDAYGVYSYAAAAVELEVDKRTFEVRVARITTAQDIGKAINPLLAEGQIIGGTAQALGYALLENVVYKDGFMQNSQLTNYIIPTSLDMPPVDVEIIEKPYSRGPFGAKGVGELPMDVPPPAIAAAVFDATGLLIPELPILPEKIWAAYQAASGGAKD
jgi:CO/xanthine dehydrogenase Mo-binding subunit